ncbi:hypothetical protein, partial [Aeromonas salmonicida]
MVIGMTLLADRHDVISHKAGGFYLVRGSKGLNGVVAQISQQIMISPAPSDRYTRGFLTGRP